MRKTTQVKSISMVGVCWGWFRKHPSFSFSVGKANLECYAMKQSTEIQIDLSVFYRLFIKVSRIRVKYCLFSQVQDENMSFMVYKTQTNQLRTLSIISLKYGSFPSNLQSWLLSIGAAISAKIPFELMRLWELYLIKNVY